MIKIQYGKLTVEADAPDIIVILQSKGFENIMTKLTETVTTTVSGFLVEKLADLIKKLPPDEMVLKD